MAKNKTSETELSVEEYISKIDDEIKRDDAIALVSIYTRETGFKAKMWGTSIIGFGSYHYKYESGHEGDTCLAGFSPRSTSLVLYLGAKTLGEEKLMTTLGKHKTSKGCLSIKKLADVDTGALKRIISHSFKEAKKTHSA